MQGRVDLFGGAAEFTNPLTVSPGGTIAGHGTLIVSGGLTSSGLWSALNLASGQSVFMALSGVIGIATGTLTNTVTVSGLVDTNPGNKPSRRSNSHRAIASDVGFGNAVVSFRS